MAPVAAYRNALFAYGGALDSGAAKVYERHASMAYLPKDAEWFLAEMVQEIRVAGSKRNIVHINYVVIRAKSPKAAYLKAMALGRRGSISYLNPHGKKVTIRFCGLGNLDVIYDPLGDECEIMFREILGVSRKGIKKLVRTENQLEVFKPISRRVGRPNYSSKEILDMLEKRLGRKIDAKSK